MAFPKENTGSNLFVRFGVVGWVTCVELLGASGRYPTPAIIASWPCFSQIISTWLKALFPGRLDSPLTKIIDPTANVVGQAGS